jgi:hypothetical protein
MQNFKKLLTSDNGDSAPLDKSVFLCQAHSISAVKGVQQTSARYRYARTLVPDLRLCRTSPLRVAIPLAASLQSISYRLHSCGFAYVAANHCNQTHLSIALQCRCRHGDNPGPAHRPAPAYSLWLSQDMPRRSFMALTSA